MDLANIIVPTAVKKDHVMEDAVSKIGDLQQMLQTEFERIKRSSSRLSTSSLGILKNNEVESGKIHCVLFEIFNYCEIYIEHKQSLIIHTLYINIYYFIYSCRFLQPVVFMFLHILTAFVVVVASQCIDNPSAIFFTPK